MEHRYELFWEYQGYRIVECLECGFKHIVPLPEELQVDEFYRQIYHNQIVKFPYHEITGDEVKQRLLQVDQTLDYIDIYTKVGQLIKTGSQFRIVDIGSGHNLILKYFLNRGWQGWGIEPGKEAAEYLRKFELEIHEVTVELVDTLDLQDIAFINMQYVLEHVVNPLAVLKKLFAIMAPGGIIRLVVPNDFSAGQLAYAEYHHSPMKWINLPDHLNYFGFDSMSRLLGKAGFREVYRTTNFPLEFLLLGGVNYYASEDEQKKVWPFVHNFETALRQTNRSELLVQLYESLAQLGMGRAVVLYAIKD